MALVDTGFVAGVLPAGGQVVVPIPAQLRTPPATITLTSAAAGRLIELCTDGVPTNYFTPSYDVASAAQLIAIANAPFTHVRLTGAAGDAYRVQT